MCESLLVYRLTNINVVFSQSHQGEEEDVPVQTPEEDRVQSSQTARNDSRQLTCNLRWTRLKRRH